MNKFKVAKLVQLGIVVVCVVLNLIMKVDDV